MTKRAKFIQVAAAHDGAGGTNLYALDKSGRVWLYCDSFGWTRLQTDRYAPDDDATAAPGKEL